MKRVGAFGHIGSDEEHEPFRAHGAIVDDPVRGAREVLIMEQGRGLFLDE